MVDDLTLIKQVNAGDLPAFEQLVKRHENKVFAMIARRLPRQAVEEVAQQTFLAAYRSLPNYCNKSPFEHWISAICRRKCMDYWRQHHRNKEDLSPTDMTQWLELHQSNKAREDFNKEVWLKEARGLLDCVLSRLDAEERELILSVYFEDLSMNEVAESFGISISNAKVRAHRARKKMRRLLDELTEGTGL